VDMQTRAIQSSSGGLFPWSFSQLLRVHSDLQLHIVHFPVHSLCVLPVQDLYRATQLELLECSGVPGAFRIPRWHMLLPLTVETTDRGYCSGACQ
jgi:hypothetical protein